MHQNFGMLGKGPPYPNPVTTLPYVDGGFDFKLPKPLKNRRCFIGSVIALHRSISIPHPKTGYPVMIQHRPESGPIGFAVYLCDYLTWCESNGPCQYLWYGWDSDEQKELIVRICSEKGPYDTEAQGACDQTYLGMVMATTEQAKHYWEEDLFRRWPDWLHSLETKAYRMLYKAAEEQFGIRMPWGVYKGALL